jgi:hypothetical protein
MLGPGPASGPTRFMTAPALQSVQSPLHHHAHLRLCVHIGGGVRSNAAKLLRAVQIRHLLQPSSADNPWGGVLHVTVKVSLGNA